MQNAIEMHEIMTKGKGYIFAMRDNFYANLLSNQQTYFYKPTICIQLLKGQGY